jgi:hypothetical protein
MEKSIVFNEPAGTDSGALHVAPRPILSGATGFLGSARSEAGNAVAVVLLVLGVVSLLGIGLLTRSTMDTRFSAAYKSHERMFSLADGAANIAFAWLALYGAAPETFVPNLPNQQPLVYPSVLAGEEWKKQYSNPFYVRKADNPAGSRPDGSAAAVCAAEEEKGMYWPVISFLGIGLPPAGFEYNKFETQYWIATGLVTTDRSATTGGAPKGAPRAQASVQLAVQKTVKK